MSYFIKFQVLYIILYHVYCVFATEPNRCLAAKHMDIAAEQVKYLITPTIKTVIEEFKKFSLLALIMNSGAYHWMLNSVN